MTLDSRLFPVVPEPRESPKTEVVLVPCPKGRGKREQVTNLPSDVVPGNNLEGTTSEAKDLADCSVGLNGPTQQPTIRPIVKWVGGKGRMLPELLARAPQTFDRYFEPFAGGAALCFALRPAHAFLGDANPDLIACYRAVALWPEAVIDSLRRHEQAHSAAHYYAVREAFNGERHLAGIEVQLAAAFLYLNRAGYNGLYRVNKAGAFNVSFGKADEVRFDLDNLRAASRVLRGVELVAGNYQQCVEPARAGDFVYLDPPYDDTFNAYTSEAFDQVELALCAAQLAARGVHVMLSNSDTPRVRELYRDFSIEVVRAPRSVNADGKGRGAVNELLITNPRRPIVATQTEIPGTEDKDRIPAVEAAINEWLDAKVQQRRAADATKTKHQTIIALYAEHGIEHHTYADPKTGKPKRLWLAKEPKAKSSSIAVPRARKSRRGGPSRERDVEIAGEKEATEDNVIEMRRVPRSTVEAEIAQSDGFASIREQLEAKQAEAKKQASKAKGKGKKK